MARLFISIALVVIVSGWSGGCTDGIQAGDEAEVRRVLTDFLQAFENGNLAVMEASFAADSVTFPRAIMSAEMTGPINTDEYLRVNGLDPQMRMLIAGWESSSASAPYLDLDPLDFEIKMFSDAALATFHLRNDSTLSRRTFVLAIRNDAWKIMHLHASNVVGTE